MHVVSDWPSAVLHHRDVVENQHAHRAIHPTVAVFLHRKLGRLAHAVAKSLASLQITIGASTIQKYRSEGTFVKVATWD